MDEDVTQGRPVFHAIQVDLLDCQPGNYSRADGEPAAVVTIGRKMAIEPLVFNLADARRLAAALLVVLATYEDTFAAHLLDVFPARKDGTFHWPD